MNTKRLIDIEFAKSNGYFVGWSENAVKCQLQFSLRTAGLNSNFQRFSLQYGHNLRFPTCEQTFFLFLLSYLKLSAASYHKLSAAHTISFMEIDLYLLSKILTFFFLFKIIT